MVSTPRLRVDTTPVSGFWLPFAIFSMVPNGHSSCNSVPQLLENIQ
ncbi:hypothetical protein SLEP1_g2413 [Rubroshorea leprosula]|uniref:Uncharacterized protein n=1 Tax=Rubroshorea leprosula TaxID=152421 RepID=A0AAV5HQW5_9ROSI|nr:hypothetical protein SLEP1_g2413 [Rubroshorea leprosula]